MSIACALCSIEFAVAASQEVVPLNGAPFAGALVSIDAAGSAKFRVAGTPELVELKLSDLVRWGNPVPPRPQTIVVLADGGQLITAPDWSGGAAVQLQNRNLTVISDVLDKTILSREAVRGIVFAQRERADERERLVAQIRRGSDSAGSTTTSSNAHLDVIHLTNGDRVSGDVIALERGSMTLKTTSGETSLPLSRVQSIEFAGSRKETSTAAKKSDDLDSPALSQTERFIVGLSDGSLIHTRKIEAAADRVTLHLANGKQLTVGNVDDIVAIQAFGPQFQYLSDIQGADYRFVPYFRITWPLVADRSVLGGPLVVGGKRFLKGLGLHSAARVTYQLPTPYQRFDARVGIDDAANGRGSAVFGVYVQRDGKWQPSYTSETVRGGAAPLQVSVDLRGATGITLTVDYADRGDELDYADWLDARLVR